MSALLRQQFLKQYVQTSVETGLESATPHRLISMLYRGALDRINQARGLMEQNNYAKKGELISRAMAIIAALRSGLDFNSGKEVAENLDALYEYCNRRLFEANRENDPQILEEVSSLIRTVADAWDEMPENMRRASESQLQQLKSMTQ